MQGGRGGGSHWGFSPVEGLGLCPGNWGAVGGLWAGEGQLRRWSGRQGGRWRLSWAGAMGAERRDRAERVRVRQRGAGETGRGQSGVGGRGEGDGLTQRPLGPHSTPRPMEDPSEARWPAPLGALSPPAAALCLAYSLAILAAYLLEVASRGLVIRAAGPHLPPALSAAWFGHQAATDIAFTVLLPLAVTWTPSCRPLGAAFCRLDPGLGLLTFYASGRLLAREAADRCASTLWPAWALRHRGARRAAFWAGGFWLLLLALGERGLRGGGCGGPARPENGTSARGLPHLSSLELNQLVFSFGVPLGVLGALHSLLRAQLRLAGLTGRPPLLGLPWASGALLFLCWFPFHLLMLLRLLGVREARLGLAEVGVLLRPLGLALAGACGCLNPLLYVCGDQAFRQRLWGTLWSCPGEGLGRRQGRLGDGDAGPTFLPGPEWGQ